MDDHLTADELRGFARHEGSASDVRRIARHLESCEACRAGSPARGTVAGILGVDEEHLTFEQLAAMAEGETGGGEGHVRRCATCARELADLREFRESRWSDVGRGFSPPLGRGGGARESAALAPGGRAEATPYIGESHHSVIPSVARDLGGRGAKNKPAAPPAQVPRSTLGMTGKRWAWAAAAAVLIALVAGGFFAMRIEARRHEARLAEVALPAEVLAMQSRRLSFRGVGSAALDVIEPRDTVVMSDRPVFRWNAPEGATSVVEVFAPDFTRVATSPALTARTWTPPAALRRGVTYRWQVTAGGVTIPAPPLPEALFLVVPEEQAKAVHDLERSAERPSLELASAYAKAGDFDRARAELRALLAGGKQTQAAEKLLRRIETPPGRSTGVMP
ncbi:MAG TPA: hypothetical protein VF432_11235 [Thermoanaerobaculia bacterium]